MEPYKNSPVDHTASIDFSKLAGKEILITGGANGMGETMVRRFAASGAQVTFGDVNAERGKLIEDEVNAAATKGGRAKFVRCDIRSWDDQVRLFDATEGVDVVIANAGISRSSGDSLWVLDDPAGPPKKPALNIIDTNITGTLYTFKLAVHYFRKQPVSDQTDRCFIMTGSMVTYIDSAGNWEYTVSKYGLRGLMKTVRRSSHQQGIRINYVAPCWISSAIRTREYEQGLVDQGVQFGESEDVASCMARIITDRSINGRSLMIVPRNIAKEGYMDPNLDDFVDYQYFEDTQEVQLRVIKADWVD